MEIQMGLNNEKGFTILEVVIAMLIFTFGILGLAGMQATYTTSNVTSRDFTEAARFSADSLEKIKALKYADLADMAADPTKAVDGYTVSWTEDEPEVKYLVNGAEVPLPKAYKFKTITLTVTWHDEKGKQKQMQLQMVKPQML